MKGYEFLKKFFGAATDIIIITDLRFIVYYANSAAVKLLGEIIGKNISACISKEDLLLNSIITRQIGGKDPVSFEWIITSQNKGRIYLEVEQSIVEDEGIPSGYLFIGRNVTESKRKYEQSQNNQKMHADFFHKHPSMHFILDSQMNVILVNKSGAKQLGYAYDEIIGKNPLFLVYPDDADGVVRQLKECLENPGNVYEMQFRKVRKDGEVIIVREVVYSMEKDGERQIMITCNDVTKIKKTEDDLIAEREKFRKFFESMTYAAYVIQEIDGITQFVYANEEFTKSTGYDIEELKGRSIFSIIHPDFHGITKERAAARLRGEDVEKRYEMKMITKLGEEKWILYSGVPIEFNGQPAILGSSYDITDMKLSEQKIRKSLRQFEVFLNSANSMIGLKKMVDGRLVNIMANTALVEFWGGKLSDFIGKTDYEIMPEEAALECEKSDLQALQEKRLVVTEQKINDKTFEVRKFPVKLIDGAVGVGLNIYDITGFKKAQEVKAIALEALRKSENRSRAFLEYSPEVIMQFSAEAKIEYVNPAIKIYYPNKTPEDFIGKTLDQMGYEPHITKMNNQSIRLVFDTGRIIRKEIKIFDNLYFDWQVVPIFDSDGSVISVITSSRDVTADVKNRNKMIKEEKDQAIGKLAGGVAHDFNNILQIISGYAALLQMAVKNDEKMSKSIQTILDATYSGGDLTRQLLGYAREGKMDVTLIDTNDMVTKATRLFGRVNKEVAIKQISSPDVWPIMADKTQIEQVLVNLFLNAKQAMTAGSGTITIQTSNEDVTDAEAETHNVNIGKYVKISVSDNGMGIPKNIMSKIFDPFFTTKEMGRGTGLGLASSQGIVHGHNGFITVYSEVGHGTTFNIYLPAILESDKAQSKVENEEPPHGTGKILLVDDEKIVAEVSKKVIENLGYDVAVANSGDEAIELFAKNQYDLVILDMILPDKGGKIIFTEMKKINPQVKTILATGFSLNGQAQEILDLGVMRFIQKPYRALALAKIIKEVIEK